jgi:hypothetical protein
VHNEAGAVKLESIAAQRTLLPLLDSAEQAANLIVNDLRELQNQNAEQPPMALIVSLSIERIMGSDPFDQRVAGVFGAERS